MLLFFNVVAADEINAIAIGGKPFAISTVNGYGGDVYATQQIVGIVGSIVAGNFYLLENRIVTIHLRRLEHQWSHIRSYPDVAFLVFNGAAHVP